MSIEQAIQENTKAMQDFAAALRAQTELLTQVHAAALGNTAPKKEPEVKKAQQTAAASAAQPAVTQGTQEPTGAASGDEKTYTAEDAKTLTNKVVAAGKRDEMVALLAEFDVKVAAKLPEDKIADFCKKAEVLLGGAAS